MIQIEAYQVMESLLKSISIAKNRSDKDNQLKHFDDNDIDYK